MSTFLDLMRDRCYVTMSPAVGKTRSDGTLVAGMHNTLFASFATSGNIC